jgi:hypothetical protein
MSVIEIAWNPRRAPRAAAEARIRCLRLGSRILDLVTAI